MAATGKLERHFTDFWEGNDIKFWSRNKLGTLFSETRFEEIRFGRVGSIPTLAKSMIVTHRKKIG